MSSTQHLEAESKYYSKVTLKLARGLKLSPPYVDLEKYTPLENRSIESLLAIVSNFKEEHELLAQLENEREEAREAERIRMENEAKAREEEERARIDVVAASSRESVPNSGGKINLDESHCSRTSSIGNQPTTPSQPYGLSRSRSSSVASTASFRGHSSGQLTPRAGSPISRVRKSSFSNSSVISIPNDSVETRGAGSESSRISRSPVNSDSVAVGKSPTVVIPNPFDMFDPLTPSSTSVNIPSTAASLPVSSGSSATSSVLNSQTSPAGFHSPGNVSVNGFSNSRSDMTNAGLTQSTDLSTRPNYTPVSGSRSGFDLTSASSSVSSAPSPVNAAPPLSSMNSSRSTSSLSDIWVCSVCTLHNEITMERCSACRSTRPLEYSEQADQKLRRLAYAASDSNLQSTQTDATNQWKCSTCSTMNTPNYSSCRQCFTLNPKAWGNNV